jgi:hypothetical protein
MPPKLNVKEREAFPRPSKEKVPEAASGEKRTHLLRLSFEGSADQSVQCECVGAGYRGVRTTGIGLYNGRFADDNDRKCDRHKNAHSAREVSDMPCDG